MDDATRLAHVEVLSDEQKATTVGFLTKAVGWFNEQGITSRRIHLGNGSANRAGDWRKACKVLDLNPIRTTPYRLRSNGKADRLIQPLCPGMVLCDTLPGLRREKLQATSVSDARNNAGVTWPWLTSPLSSAWLRCLLKDLAEDYN